MVIDGTPALLTACVVHQAQHMLLLALWLDLDSCFLFSLHVCGRYMLRLYGSCGLFAFLDPATSFGQKGVRALACLGSLEQAVLRLAGGE